MSKIVWGKIVAHSSKQHARMECGVGAGERAIIHFVMVGLLMALPGMVMADHTNQDKLIPFDIPEQRADLALTRFAEQADLTLFFPYDEVRECTANRLVGEYHREEAIGILLAETGLTPTFRNRISLSIATDNQSKLEGEEMSIKKKAGLGAFLAAVFSVGVSAQEPADATAGDAAFEEVVVTGSRLARKDLNSVGPVTIISAPEIAATGVTSLEMLLQRLPSSAGFGGNQTSAYWVSNGWGTPQINLRGMGINRTLVLLNGRRIVAGGTGANTSVDLSMIPMSIIERIEVLKDGASAIYGADAVAGVVNIITKQRFEGVEASVKAGAAFEGDGEELQLDLTWGVTSDKGSLMASISYQDVGEVYMPDRVECPMSEVNGELVCFGSADTIGGLAALPDGTRINFNQDPNADPKSFALYDPLIHNFDFNQSFNAVNPLERFSFSTFGNYQLSENIQLIGELMYTNRQTDQPASPTRIRGVPFAASHPTNPTGQDIVLQRKRLGETGNRDFFQETNTFRAVAGLQGEFGDAWKWDIAYNWGRNTGTDGSTNVINTIRLFDALDPNVCGSGGVPCGDILGFNNTTPEFLEYILYTAIGTGGNEQKSLTANVSGELFEMPAGPFLIAAGIESREDSGWRDPDALTAAGGSNQNAGDPIAGTVKADEIYVEVSIPLLAGVPFAEALDLDLAFRYSDYETFGGADNYKVGVNWQVVPSFKIRANFGTAFRVPNVNELFGGVAEGNLTTTDPCNGWDLLSPTDVVFINCQADGVPVGFQQLGNTILTTVGGNSALDPETADTFTLGVVIQPSFIEGLSLTIDYYDVEITDAITQIPGSTKLDVCYNTPGLAHEFCGDQSFTRSALTGDVNFLSAVPVNTGKETIQGIDFDLRYDFEAANILWSFDWKTTLLNEYEITPFEGAEPIVLDGHIGGGNGGYSNQRSYLSMNLAGDKWTGNYAIQVIGSGDDFNFDPPAIGSEMDSVVYHYIQGGYAISDHAHVAVGIDNLFDEGAPYVASWTDANTDTMTYDLTGRRGYVRFTYKWD